MIARRRWPHRALHTLVVLGALGAPAAAQPGPPHITRLVVNGGANLTTADEVTVEFQYTHPAAPGVPIPYVRVRVKPPGGVLPPWGRFFDAGGRHVFTVKLLPGSASPPGGTYEIQVQLQDGGARSSNVATGHVIRASPTPSAPPAPVQYRITGTSIPELIGFARLRGYLNTAAPMNSGAQCASSQNGAFWHLRVSKMVVPVPLGTEALPTPTCRFGFFQGKNLQHGWRYVSSAFEPFADRPASWSSYGPAPSGLSAAFSITVTGTDLVGAQEVRMNEVVFEGPPGAHWQQAFRP